MIKLLRLLSWAMLGSVPLMSAAPVHAAGGGDEGPAAKLILLSAWNKNCGEDKESRKQICYTTGAFGASLDSPAITLAVYDDKGGEYHIHFYLWNNDIKKGINVRNGVKFSAGSGDAAIATFETCSDQGCYAEAKIQRSFIDTAVRSSVVRAAFRKVSGGTILVNFELPMAGFSEAFNGPPVDAAKLNQVQGPMQ